MCLSECISSPTCHVEEGGWKTWRKATRRGSDSTAKKRWLKKLTD